MILLLVLAVLVVVAVAGFGVALAARGKRDRDARHAIIPGQRSAAPASWAGSHTLEARLHRRLGDAVKSLHAIGSDADISLVEARMLIEQEALAVDQRLITAAALPDRVRGERIAAVQPAVVAIEDAVATMADAMTSDPSRVGDAVQLVQDRIASLAAANAELDALESGSVSSEIIERLRAAAEDAGDTTPAAPPQDDDGQPSPG